MSSVTLPPEVIERVIDCCYDNSYTLRQPTLTCRLLLPWSRHHLFASIRIEGADVDTLYLFYDILAVQPWLRLLIRSVKIVARAGVALEGKNTQENLKSTMLDIIPATLLTLPRLTQWSIVIRDASLITPTAKPASFTPPCSRLGITFEQPGVLRALKQSSYRRPRKLELEHLEIVGPLADDAITVLLESCSRLATLESLSLDVSQAERFVTFISQLPGLRRFTLEIELGVESTVMRSISRLVDVLKLFGEFPTSGNAFEFILQMPIPFPSRLNHELAAGEAPGFCQGLEEQLLRIPQLRRVIFHFRGMRANRERFWMVELSQHFPKLRQRSLFGVRADQVTAIGHDNTTPRYYDEDTQASVFRNMVSAITVSQDSEWMATGSTDTTIILWCLKERRVAHQWVAHRAAVACLAFSPDSQKLMSGGRLDSGVTIWDVSLPQGVQKILILHCSDSSPEACVWSPARSDCESLVAYAMPRRGRTVHIWDVHPLQLRHTFRLVGGTICLLTFSRDGRRLATDGGNGSCSVWDTVTGALHTVLRDAGLTIHTVVFDPSGKRIATTSGRDSNAMVKIWDVEAGTRLLSFGNGLHGPLGGLNVSFSPDGRTVLSMGDRPTIWDAATGNAIRAFHGPGCMDIVYCLCFSPDGRYVAATSFDGIVKLWRVRDGACVATLSGHCPSIPHYVGFSSKAETVFYTCDDGTVYMYQLADVVRSPAY